MLPPGHAAAGFLLAKLTLELSGVNIPTSQEHSLLLLGALAGFAPDIDMFWAFARAGKLNFSEKYINHRDSIIHTPLFWTILGLAIIIIFPGNTGKLAGIITGLGGISHLLLDSFKVGIRWLWPLSNTYHAFLYPGEQWHYKNTGPGFWKYWISFLKIYSTDKTFRITFITEITILLIAAIVLKFII